MRKLLSYKIRTGAPVWPNSQGLHIKPVEQIKHGDAANTYSISLYNHFGTHFDAPRHFNENGAEIAELPFDYFFFEKPYLIDIKKQAGEKIEPSELSEHADALSKSDLLMLRTGFSRVRSENPRIYEEMGPAISSRTAEYLVNTFKNIKAVALDFISLASYSDRADGTLAHRYMLGAFGESYICIIEDANLDGIAAGYTGRVTAMPLLIENIDSAPVTLWLEE